MKSTFTVSVDTEILQKFFDTTHKQGLVKSAILQKLILEYLENGLRNNPQPLARKQHNNSRKGTVK
jgi:hypothetical protein